MVCCSVNVHGVVILFEGGGDTQPLYVVIELFRVSESRENYA